jgi:hypothetical protein
MAATIEENLSALILSDTTLKNAIGSRLAYNHVPQLDDIPYGFFQQNGSTDDSGIGDAAGLPTRFLYALEFWDTDALRVKATGRRAQQLLHKYRGTFGDTTVQAIFAESQDDNYEPRGIMDDSGFHGSFLNVEIVQPA